MFRTILVPLDGSPFAEAALPSALRLVRRAPGELHLVRAHQPAAALVGMGELPVPTTALDPELKQREASYLDETVIRLREGNQSPVEARLVDGLAGPAVCEEAARVKADLVVMATHGRGAMGRLWLGSVANYVIRTATLPVLLVRPGKAGETPDLPVPTGILVALDFSTHAEAVLEPVVAMAQLIEAEVTLLHVLEPFYAPEPAVPFPMLQDATITEVRRADAQSRLDDIAKRLRARGLDVSTRVVIGANAAGSLLGTLQDRRFGLLAMTTHGAGGLRRLLLGSVADKVIRATTKPVLVFRPLPAAQH
jgi:nucleotide-binding universal stress UspA family protein